MANEQPGEAAAYRPGDFKVLRGLEHVRKRPGMYIGGVGQEGLHWLLFQLVASSLAEAAEGYGGSLKVKLNAEGAVEVGDEGRGIGIAPHPSLDKPLLEAVLTECFIPGPGRPGRDWLDYAVANALSEWLTAETWFEGQAYRQEFRAGEPVAAPQRAGTVPVSGLRVTFKPDPAIFPDPRFSYATICHRLREYALLHSGVRVSVSDEATGEQEQFEFGDGIRSFVNMLTRGRRSLHPGVLVVRGGQAGLGYEVGMRWCRGSGGMVRSFVNDYETAHGGTHVAGLLAAVTRSINASRGKQGLAGALKGEVVRRGLTAVVSVRLARPKFGGATKDRLVSEEARRTVEKGVGQFLRQFFTSNPGVAEAIVRATTKEAGGTA